jgi:hypothetical protein
MDRDMVAAGVSQIAVGAVSGWGLAALIGIPGLKERLGVVEPVRFRQAHLDVLIMGGLVTAAGLVDDAPTWSTRAVKVGAWTNPLLFIPLAFRPTAPSSKLYAAASAASFAVTCAGWVGLARTARRAARS